MISTKRSFLFMNGVRRRGVFGILLVLGILAAISSTTFAQIIFDNASTVPASISPIGIVTRPGAGPGGADLSVLISPDNILGFGHGAGVRLVEDFTIPAGQSWSITGAHVFGYLTGSTVPSTTAGIARILDASPLGAFNVLAGDLTTNLLQPGSNQFIGINRVTTTTLTDTARRIQDNILNFQAPVVLGPGTYWFEYGLTNNSFVPPLQVVPEQASVVTGNAIQFLTNAYAPITDSGSLVAKGIPFQLIGSIVPEPTSLALVGMAIGILCLKRRSRNA